MKLLFKINLVFFIIMSILFVIPWFGMLFMIPVGVVQVISSLYLFASQNRLSSKVNGYVIIHLVSSTITLISFFYFIETMRQFELIIVTLIISGLLSLFFLYITYVNYKEFKKRESLKLSHV